MTVLMSHFLLLAQEAAEKQQNGSPMMQMLLLFGPPLLLLFILQSIFGRTEAKDKARRDAMVSTLKKNDQVVTIGGILGSIVSISEDKETVTIKADDNTRLKLQASAIREKLTQDESEKA